MNATAIEITFREAVYLSDAFSAYMEGPKGQPAPFPDLLLKVGSAFLQTDPCSSPEGEKSPASIAFTWTELWLIREVAKSSATVGQEHVGFNLMRKVYTALRRAVAETEAESVMAMETADAETGIYGNVRDRLNQWKGGGEDASAH